ncbi:prolactin receptor [Channa argus]|uniref:Prolactin receptor n=1 Tax=Channa argus TaxID=215402 RepID=A0A6G1PYT5_CHAAH|nr:prolactin receptor [Channa argus]
MRKDLELVPLTLLSVAVMCNSMSPPGKPVLLSCRSPEKETFTCWWEPGSDGGLPTMHRLFYERDNMEGTHECPDYRSAGRNSCFFDKRHTSIWVEYYLIVVASNALGNATSDPFKVDVMEIVEPNPPENVTLLLEERENSPCLDVRWEPPPNTDTKSGWVTIKYELRVKEENDDQWKEYTSGRQTHFILHNIRTGVMYMVQVRCRLDHGSWSQWSNSTYVKIPNYFQKEKPFWILISILTAVSFMTATCILVTKRKYVTQRLLPPVPGPKIRGVDVHLLQSGRAEDIANALIIHQNFPPTVALEDKIEEYITVSDNDDGLLPDTFHSQKSQKSFILHSGFHMDLEIQCKESSADQNAWEEAEEGKETVKMPLSGETLSNTETYQLPTQKQLCPGINFINTDTPYPNPSNHNMAAENLIQPLANNSYVDIQRHENLQMVDVNQVDEVNQVDYSMVKEVKGGNILIVESEKVPGYMDIWRPQENIPEDYSRVKEVDSDNVVVLQKHSVSNDSSFREKGVHYIDCNNQKLRNPHVTTPSKVGVCTELSSGYVDTVSASLM